MIKQGVIKRLVEYPPSQSDDPKKLLEYLQNTLQYTCSKQHGFIIRVIGIVRIHSQRISIYNGNIILDCKIEVDHVFPEIGHKTKGLVKQSFPQGTIVLAYDCMKVFIPSVKIASKEIVDFEIVQIRFQKGKYDCIGKIVKTLPL
jgi:DNA-directed RNA polymerase subunit E'/Rpb7